MRKIRQRQQAKKRCGVAAVEFAVCLPVLVILVFGSIEASSYIFLKQSLAVSAYEASREAVRAGSTSASAIKRAEKILESRSVESAAVRIVSGESAKTRRGQEVIVEVSAPTGVNSPLLGRFLSNRIITSRVVMLKQ